MQASLNKIWQTDSAPAGGGVKQLVKNRLLSFALVLLTGLLLLASMLLSAVLQNLESFLGKIAGLPVWVWNLAASLVSFAVITALLAAIFKWLPNAPIRWKDVWVGALFTAVLFMLGRFAIAWYLGHQAASSYGAAAAFTVLLAWLYYSSIIFLLGAEFTQAYARTAKMTDKPTNRQTDREL